VRSRSILAALVCSFLLGLSPLAAAPMIERGIDTFTTLADGKTSYDFAFSPIPSGFFCKGSKPFTGRVAFRGLPLATEVPGQLGVADTIVERLDDAVFDARGTAVTRIQFRALSLVSIAPIKTACGSFHAYVSLASNKQRVTTMRIHRAQEGGGNFIAPLAADVRLTFIPVKPAGRKGARKLELNGSFTFPATSIPWGLTDGAKGLDAVVVDTNGDLAPDTRLPGTSNFLPGFSPNKILSGSCCCENSCHTDPSTGKMHCACAIPPGCMTAQRCFSTGGL
jgi:hypothetical protein